MRISLLAVEFIILWTFSQSWALKDKDGKQQTDIFGVIYTYRCILTNNRTYGHSLLHFDSPLTHINFYCSIHSAQLVSDYGKTLQCSVLRQKHLQAYCYS